MGPGGICNRYVKRDKRRKFANQSGYTGTAVLVYRPYCLTDISDFISCLQIRKGSQYPCLCQEEIRIPSLHERMTEGQKAPSLICPGNGSQCSQGKIALYESNPYRTAGFQGFGRCFCPGSPCIHNCNSGSFQFMLKQRQTCVGKAPCHQGSPFRQKRAVSLFPMGNRLVQHIQHILNRRQKAVVGIGKGLAVGNGPGQFTVNIDRAAAHPLRNAAASFQYVAAAPDQDLVTCILTAGYAQNLHRKCFNSIAGYNGFSISPHTGLQAVYRHQRCPGKDLRSKYT